MNKTTKKYLLRYVLSPILLVVFLWLIYIQIQKRGSFAEEWQGFRDNLDARGLWLLAVALLLAPLNWLAEAFKWQTLLRRITFLPLKRAYASVLSGMALAFVTPNKSGDFLGRILYLKKESRLRGAIASLVSIVAQWIVTFFFGLAGMVYLQLYHPAAWTFTVGIAAGAGLLLLLYGYAHIGRLAGRVGRRSKLRALLLSLYLLKRYSRVELWRVLGIALLRFCIYNGQFLILLFAFDSGIPVLSGFLLSGLMFWLITVIPTFFVADIGVRGFVTGLVFINTGIAGNPFTVLAAAYGLWVINWVVPAVIGSILTVKEGASQA